MTPRRQNSQKVRRNSASQALVIVLLEYPRVAGQVDARPPLTYVSGAEERGSSGQRFAVGDDDPRDGLGVGVRERTDVHPSASESSASENPLSERSSTSGRGFASSPRRLIQIERSPSSRAGAMSWNRLAATCTWPLRSAPVRAKNSSQWRWAGLYEPISDATMASSNGTPIRSIDASM